MSGATEVQVVAPQPPAREEAGTAPGDRRFRPDVEGLRAVAVLLVVLFHASLPELRGGFVGVDVFFVISGFVITGLLLRERSSTGHTSLTEFYARRVRRILPAATLVIVTTTIATYVVLGVVFGDPTAISARWTAVFLANFHFANIGTNYLTSTLPPVPLQNFWSLAVEEQFYLVFPALFLVVASIGPRTQMRARLVLLTIVIVVCSFALSALLTPADPVTAFYSPFTRAWELALGAMVALSTPLLLRLHPRAAATMTWAGLGAILFSAVAYTTASTYPGVLVAVPVLGTALVIAGGTSQPARGVEALLRVSPVQWLGRLSYSVYLWHWPILIIAAEAAGKTQLPFLRNIGWLAMTVVVAVISARLVENPVRHATTLLRRRRLTLGIGAVLVAVSLAAATVALNVAGAGPVAASDPPFVYFSNASLAQAIRAAPMIGSVPAGLVPTLSRVRNDWGGPAPPCWPALRQTSIPACIFGDPNGSHTLALYGDSHAAMWFGAMNFIAAMNHWRLLYLGKGNCPASDLPYNNPAGVGTYGGVYIQCQQWHTFALERMKKMQPDVVIITQYPEWGPGRRGYSPSQWERGLASTIHEMPVPASRVIVLGNIPSHTGAGPQCLSLHVSDVQACSGPPDEYLAVQNGAERSASAQAGARFIDTVPWFCSAVCADVIGHYQPYFDRAHITDAYAKSLIPVLNGALDLSSYVPTLSPATSASPRTTPPG